MKFSRLPPKDGSLLVPGRGGGGGQHRRVFGRKHCVVVGLLVTLASSGHKVGRSLAKVGGQHRRIQVSYLPIGAPETLAAKLKEREREREEMMRKTEKKKESKMPYFFYGLLKREKERKRKRERKEGERE